MPRSRTPEGRPQAGSRHSRKGEHSSAKMYKPHNNPPTVSSLSKRLRRSVEPRRGRPQAGSRLCAKHVVYAVTKITFNRNGTTHGSLPTNIIHNSLRSFQGCSAHPPYQTCAKPHNLNHSDPPKTKKTSPMTPPHFESKSNFCFLSGGDMGEVLVEWVGLGEGETPLRKRGLSLPKVFPSILQLLEMRLAKNQKFSLFQPQVSEKE
mgnify:CR=1 FL=1